MVRRMAFDTLSPMLKNALNTPPAGSVRVWIDPMADAHLPEGKQLTGFESPPSTLWQVAVVAVLPDANTSDGVATNRANRHASRIRLTVFMFLRSTGSLRTLLMVKASSPNFQDE